MRRFNFIISLLVLLLVIGISCSKDPTSVEYVYDDYLAPLQVFGLVDLTNYPDVGQASTNLFAMGYYVTAARPRLDSILFCGEHVQFNISRSLYRIPELRISESRVWNLPENQPMDLVTLDFFSGDKHCQTIFSPLSNYADSVSLLSYDSIVDVGSHVSIGWARSERVDWYLVELWGYSGMAGGEGPSGNYFITTKNKIDLPVELTAQAGLIGLFILPVNGPHPRSTSRNIDGSFIEGNLYSKGREVRVVINIGSVEPTENNIVIPSMDSVFHRFMAGTTNDRM